MTRANYSCLLAIDTSTTYLSIGLYVGGEYYVTHQHVGHRHSDYILPIIHDLLHQHQLDIQDFEALVYAKGPGSFTGLRIGLGVAEGLATPWNTPLIGIPCLDAVAALAPNHDYVLAATDARMHELFYAWYDTNQQQRLTDYRVGNANDIELPLGCCNHAVGVGNAFALNITLPVQGDSVMPTAKHYLQLALSECYDATLPEHAELLYIRNKIAMTAAEQLAKQRLPTS